MRDEGLLQAGDAITKTVTFTLAAGEAASSVTLLLTRTNARSEHPTIGRARCIVLEAQLASDDTSAGRRTPDSKRAGASRQRSTAWSPLQFAAALTCRCCVFAYHGDRAPTGFEVDADQRFALDVADDATAVGGGPSISSFSST